MKRLSTQAIYNELVAVLGVLGVLGPNAIRYSTIINYLRQRHFPSTLRETPHESLHGIY
jgi:transcriptional regulator of heat shock response